MAELGNINKTSKVFEVGTFVVEFPQCIVLCTIPLTERLKCFVIIGSYINRDDIRKSSRETIEITHFYASLAAC